MAIYRFRVVFEEDDEIYRDIDIKSSQNFKDFHEAILQSIKFENDSDASFFISDDSWRKGDEIALTSEDTSKRIMSKSKIVALIDDPHQKFIYINDPKSPWEFLIELQKIVGETPGTTYPACIKSEGEAPKKKVIIPTAADFDDEDEFDLEEVDDESAYANDVDEAIDINDLGDIEVSDTPDGNV